MEENTYPSWESPLDPSVALDLLREAARRHAERSGPFRQALLKAIAREDYRFLVSFSIDYELPDLTAEHVAQARQSVAFFSKLAPLSIGVNKEEAAFATFVAAEELNAETNKRLLARRKGLLGFPARVEQAFRIARLRIASVLNGEVPLPSEMTLRFGPGSTRRTRKAEASVAAKVAEGFTCSRELFQLAPAILSELPLLVYANADSIVRASEGERVEVSVEIMTSKLRFVPKNAKTHRTIGIEPQLNLMYQLGLGEVIAKRLAAFGVDIRDQGPNKAYALEGSLTGALATLDLSSASDTISKELVFELLPLDWAVALARGRSRDIELPSGRIMQQEKFSAMGNGFTFPLETLIFWGLAGAVLSKHDVLSVYGDDIIVPSSKFDDATEVLRYAGFNVNYEKSYCRGPFRESCGSDYFRGSPVRPFYQKDEVSVMSLFLLHNHYVRRGDTEMAGWVLNRINPVYRVFGPDGFGDGHLIGEHDRTRRTPAQCKRGFGGYFFEAYKLKGVSSETSYPPEVVLASACYIAGYRLSSDLKRQRTDWLYGVKNAAYPVSFIDAVIGDSTPLTVGADGQPCWPLPGRSGSKKVKIYTLGD